MGVLKWTINVFPFLSTILNIFPSVFISSGILEIICSSVKNSVFLKRTVLIDLSLLLEDVYDSFKILISNKNINLLYSYNKEIYILGDYERLKQVFVNVLKNCVKKINYQQLNLEKY